MQTTIRIKRERKELIAKYATASGSLYGVISITEFVDLFNWYEEDRKTNVNEALLALQRLSKIEKVSYSLFDEFVVWPDLSPQTTDGQEEIRIIREDQRTKFRYVPTKAEFLKYVDFKYCEPESPYVDLKNFIIKHKLVDNNDSDAIEKDAVNTFLMIKNMIDEKHLMDYFIERGYKFEGKEIVNGFAKKIMDVYNNTRLFENNGYTTYEVQVKKSAVSKVGRNNFCPCGSGKKYKRCHGHMR